MDMLMNFMDHGPGIWVAGGEGEGHVVKEFGV